MKEDQPIKEDSKEHSNLLVGPILEVAEPSQQWLGKKVLIADDSPMMQEILKRCYQKLGLHISGVVNHGLEVLEACKTSPPDLLSLDIIMPEMHGVECFKELSKLGTQFPVIFISCLSGYDDLKAKLQDQSPPHYFLKKPQNEAEMLKELELTLKDISVLTT